jgi:hypothetical protein
MAAMPGVVTHLYDPAVGACPNICALDDGEAERVLHRLRASTRPGLKPNYLARRRATEQWLRKAARKTLGRELEGFPAYFFLGDFSHTVDHSRPAALVLPLAELPPAAITFTLGDSMSVADPSTYGLAEMTELFADGIAIDGFGFSDEGGFQQRFIEVQLWESYSFGRPLRTRFMS